MKYSPQNYARAFSDLVRTMKTDAEQTKFVKHFWAAVERNGDLARRTKIITEAEEILRKKDGRDLWVVDTARTHAVSAKELLKDIAKPKDIIKERIIPELVAGVRVTKNGEEQLDATLQSRLNALFAQA